MTRRYLILAGPSVLLASNRTVKAINAVSTAGVAFDRPFVQWAAVWNTMLNDYKHFDRSLEEAAAWEGIPTLFRELEDARNEYGKRR